MSNARKAVLHATDCGRVVRASINYLAPGVTDPVLHADKPAQTRMPLNPCIMPIEDVRPNAKQMSLDKEGICLVEAPSVVKGYSRASESCIGSHIYRSEISEIVQKATGAEVVVVGPLVFRASESSPEFGKPSTFGPARYAHCDYSDASGPSIALQMFPDPKQTARFMNGRYAIFNTWRVLSTPPHDTTLAVCDARSVDPTDLVPLRTTFGESVQSEYSIETNIARYNSNHRWCYFAGMRPEEVLIFRGYDSESATSRRVPHTAFDVPATDSQLGPRLSIDVRVVVYFGK